MRLPMTTSLSPVFFLAIAFAAPARGDIDISVCNEGETPILVATFAFGAGFAADETLAWRDFYGWKKVNPRDCQWGFQKSSNAAVNFNLSFRVVGSDGRSRPYAVSGLHYPPNGDWNSPKALCVGLDGFRDLRDLLFSESSNFKDYDPPCKDGRVLSPISFSAYAGGHTRHRITLRPTLKEADAIPLSGPLQVLPEGRPSSSVSPERPAPTFKTACLEYKVGLFANAPDKHTYGTESYWTDYCTCLDRQYSSVFTADERTRFVSNFESFEKTIVNSTSEQRSAPGFPWRLYTPRNACLR